MEVTSSQQTHTTQNLMPETPCFVVGMGTSYTFEILFLNCIEFPRPFSSMIIHSLVSHLPEKRSLSTVAFFASMGMCNCQSHSQNRLLWAEKNTGFFQRTRKQGFVLGLKASKIYEDIRSQKSIHDFDFTLVLR